VCIGAVVLVIALVFSSGNNTVIHEELPSIKPKEDLRQMTTSNSYTVHGRIVIDSNADFTTQGWPGNGSSENPFVIEDLFIKLDIPCISISDTTMYFEVRNCRITSSSLSDRYGIEIENVANGSIKDCIIDQHVGGIILEDSVNCNLSSNIAINNRYFGFRLDDSDSCILKNNTASGSSNGISFTNSDNCTITNNTIVSNTYTGFSVFSSKSCTIANNTFIDNGLTLSGNNVIHWFHKLSGNTVNNKPLGYIVNHTNIAIDCALYGQIILVNCSDSTITNGVFTNTSVGIGLAYSSNCTISHNTANNNSKAGFLLQYSINCTLKENTVSYNNYGFYLYSSDSCTLMKNVASFNIYGVSLEYSDKSTLSYNFLSNNSFYGAWLRYSDYCILTNNTALNNERNGFNIYSVVSCLVINNTAMHNPGSGFYIAFSDQCIFRNNTATKNTYDGFMFVDTNHCTVVNNTITSNGRYGIQLNDNCRENILYMNQFGDNSRANAWDDGISNTWDDGFSSGNYWMDYINGTGPYMIPGNAGSMDNYPFVWKPVPASDPIPLILVLSGAGIAVVVIVIIMVLRKRKL